MSSFRKFLGCLGVIAVMIGVLAWCAVLVVLIGAADGYESRGFAIASVVYVAVTVAIIVALVIRHKIRWKRRKTRFIEIDHREFLDPLDGQVYTQSISDESFSRTHKYESLVGMVDQGSDRANKRKSFRLIHGWD